MNLESVRGFRGERLSDGKSEDRALGQNLTSSSVWLRVPSLLSHSSLPCKMEHLLLPSPLSGAVRTKKTGGVQVTCELPGTW